jgi:hypothetical protein
MKSILKTNLVHLMGGETGFSRGMRALSCADNEVIVQLLMVLYLNRF